MAEDEIRKHTKAALNTLYNKGIGWKKKIREVLVEILIIIFAVSVSIWFHNWSEKLKEHKEENTFLTEMLSDLHADSINIQNSLKFYKFSLAGIQYFLKVGQGDILKSDSLQKYGNLFFSNTELRPHISRYQAIKGSGKFDIIENKQLLNNIIDLHESVLTRIESLNKYYSDYIQRVASFIEDNAKVNVDGHIVNGQEMLRTSKLKLLLSYGRGIIKNNILKANEEGLQKCNELSSDIVRDFK